MAFATIVAFDRPLGNAVLPGARGRLYSEQEMAAREEQAYHRGGDAARARSDQQIVEMRAELQALSDGFAHQVGRLEASLTAQVREALPALAAEIARRLLAGFEPPPEVIARICEEALGQLFPERENLELVLAAADAQRLQQLNPGWLARYPGLRISVDPHFSSGDCQVRSRFGLTDARLQTKLAALQQHLGPAGGA